MDEGIGTSIAQVLRLMRRKLDARARRIGVVRLQWIVPGLLKARAGSNQRALAAMPGVEQITVGWIPERSQEAVPVHHRADPANRCAFRIV